MLMTRLSIADFHMFFEHILLNVTQTKNDTETLPRRADGGKTKLLVMFLQLRDKSETIQKRNNDSGTSSKQLFLSFVRFFIFIRY